GRTCSMAARAADENRARVRRRYLALAMERRSNRRIVASRVLPVHLASWPVQVQQKTPAGGDKGCANAAVPYLASFLAGIGTLPRNAGQAAGLHRAVSLHLS